MIQRMMTCLALLALAQAAEAGNGLRLSIINTSGTTTLEALTYSGGSWFTSTDMNHMAVLVEHPQGNFLFDTGLGREIDTQYDLDMPWWMAPMMTYDPPNPVRDQLDAAGYAIPERVILSHVHWDHASGVHDFPESDIWVRPVDRAFIKTGPRGPVMPSQFTGNAIRWHEMQLDGPPYRAYASSLDLFGDGAAILVPMPGHTPGSVGLFLRTDSGNELLFSGDIVWNAKAIADAKPKIFMVRLTADADADGTMKEIKRLQLLQKEFPDLLIVPAHDSAVHSQLATFPQWFE
ncbi:MAG: MBL fold metallo-hydrolase [Oceanococcus sp.]